MPYFFMNHDPMKRTLSVLVSLLLILVARGQSDRLTLSEEFQAAVAANTRTMTGEPGTAYFQNRSEYDLRARLDPETDSLFGDATIIYFNESPDTLTQLVLRLYPDLYKRGFDRDEDVAQADLTDGVGIGYLNLNGQRLDMAASTERRGTNLFIYPATPILPGQETEISLTWAFQIPRKSPIRMGRYGTGIYFIAYWYPQMAVYDDLRGWDLLDYTGTTEFYNDFSDFHLEIEVPQGYLLWSTGLWQNAEAILAEPFLARYRAAWTSDTVISIVTKQERTDNVAVTRPSETGWHTWVFEAEQVPDAAFAIAEDYLWDGVSAVVDTVSGRRVMCDAAYRDKAKDFYEVAGYAQEVVQDLSFEIPGIPFPYPKITIFNGEKGGGGMEYPMMVNDASVLNELFAFSLTYHEIAHTYFPFMMGIDERRYAWMDEGWATFLPEDLIVKKGLQDGPMRWSIMGYLAVAGSEREAALMTPSYELEGMAYGVASYSRPGVAYYILRDILGEARFREVLRGYMDRWEGKHPTPYDFFLSFEDLSGEDLWWFWKPWFFETGIADLALQHVVTKGKRVSLEVENRGTLPVPIYLTFDLEDGTEVLRTVNASYWKDGETVYALEEKFDAKVERIELGATWIPDVNTGDNKW